MRVLEVSIATLILVSIVAAGNAQTNENGTSAEPAASTGAGSRALSPGTSSFPSPTSLNGLNMVPVIPGIVVADPPLPYAAPAVDAPVSPNFGRRTE